MAGPQTIWGIDIGRCALKAVKLRSLGDGKVELVASDYIEHPKILSQPDANRDELIGESLEKFLSRNDLSKDKVYVNVPGQNTLARFTKLPPVAPKKIPDIVRYEADQQIPFDMDEVIWDYQTFQHEDLPDVEVGIFAMKRELIREHLLHFEQASIEPVGVQTGPLAVYNAVQFNGLLADDTTIILDIGAETTDLIIATQHSLWTRNIAIGGNNFTEALVKSFKLSFSKAENLKRTAQSSKYARQVFQAMRPVFADLVQELQRSIGFYSSTHRDAEIEKIIGVGNAFKLPGLQKYLQQNLSLDVERPEQFGEITGESSESYAEEILSFGCAIGLAIQGLDLGKLNTNLLPTEIARQMVWAKKKPTFAAAAACILLAGGLIVAKQTTDLNALRASSTPPSISDVDQASQVILSGSPTSNPPRMQALQILKAGEFLKREVNKLSNEGQAEQAEKGQLIGFQQNKAIVPGILQLIHDSVPRPQGPLAEAQTQGAFLAALDESPVPRDQREQIVIRAIDMDYLIDTNEIQDWQYNFIESSLEKALITIDDAGQPGFVIRITCTSPHKDRHNFVNEAFMDKLIEGGRKPDLPWHVNRVFMTNRHVIDVKEGAGATVVTAPDRGRPIGGGMRRPGGRGRPGSKVAERPEVAIEVSKEFDEKAAAAVDPITGESVTSDYVFEITMDIFLGSAPEIESFDEGMDEEAAP